MAAIITVTFSPCIDKSITVPELLPEKKLRCSHPKLEPGGGGINVARVIHKLGGDVVAIFPSGGYTGQYFNHLVAEEKVPCVIVNTKNETRENFIVLDESTGNQYRFGIPGTVLYEEEWKSCLKEIENSNAPEFVIVSGSVPPGAPASLFQQIAAIAANKQSKLVVDTSGPALLQAATAGAYLIKPNLGELACLAGEKLIEPGKLAAVAKKVLSDYPVEILVVSAGNEGAMLFTKKETYQVTAPKVVRKSTVGAGDSMVAGIVYSLTKESSLLHALQFGVACGSAATMNPGTELCSVADARSLFTTLQALQQ